MRVEGHPTWEEGGRSRAQQFWVWEQTNPVSQIRELESAVCLAALEQWEVIGSQSVLSATDLPSDQNSVGGFLFCFVLTTLCKI